MTTDDDTGHAGDGPPPDDGRQGPGMREVLGRVVQDLREVTGLDVERTSGLQRTDDGWQARLEVLEVGRVPPSTDVLATYEVRTDGNGSLTSFDRVRRYRRSEVDA